MAALSLAAWIALIQGNHVRAAPLLDQAEAAAAALDLDDAFGPLDIARATRLWLVEQDPARARDSLSLFRRAAEAFRAAGAIADEWLARLFLTMSAASLRRLDVARTESVTLLTDAEEAQAPWCISWALWSRALVELLDSRPRHAAGSAQEASRIQREIGDAWGPAWSLWLIALIAAQLGEFTTAAQVLGGARAQQQSTQASVLGLTPFLRLQRQAETAGRHALGKDAHGNDEWDSHVTAAQKLSTSEMHALALAPLASPEPDPLPAGIPPPPPPPPPRIRSRRIDRPRVDERIDSRPAADVAPDRQHARLESQPQARHGEPDRNRRPVPHHPCRPDRP
nr:hypothetical protein [Amycolatopsis australiensis]